MIQHFWTASDVVRHRNTSSLIDSPESIANSRRLCTRSLGILNCTGVQLPVNSCEGPLCFLRRDGAVGDSSAAASSESPIGESATGCTGLSSRAAARTATARRNSGVPNVIEDSSMIRRLAGCRSVQLIHQSALPVIGHDVIPVSRQQSRSLPNRAAGQHA